MKLQWGLLGLVGALVLGCGGQSVSKTSTIAGTVLDIDNLPVRDALVATRFGSTRTSPTGAYVLTAQGSGAVDITATISRNGVPYRGRATAFDYKNERTQSINIIVGPEDEVGIISGNVQDRFGNVLQDASVFAYNGAGSSVRVFSNEDGDYEFQDLVGGVTYTVLAGGQGYRSDSTQIVLGTSEHRNANFVLDDPGLPNLQPPQNVFATSWVSPSDSTKSPKGNPYDAIKKLVDPKYRPGRSGKASRAPAGTIVEIDLEWDEQRFSDLLGYGIYRASSANGNLVGVDFLPEPLAAFYVDLDLQPNSTYSYGLTTISASFPDFPDQTESDLSDRVVSETLSKLTLSNPTLNPLTFRWQSGSGADSFVVFLFDEFPGIGVTSIWNNSGNRATGTSATYTGPVLDIGTTYYYVVVGLANNDESRTISQVASFKL